MKDLQEIVVWDDISRRFYVCVEDGKAMLDDIKTLERERDDARERIDAMETERTIREAYVANVERERDEARDDLICENADEDGKCRDVAGTVQDYGWVVCGYHYNLLSNKKAMLERERDEARAIARHLNDVRLGKAIPGGNAWYEKKFPWLHETARLAQIADEQGIDLSRVKQQDIDTITGKRVALEEE